MATQQQQTDEKSRTNQKNERGGHTQQGMRARSLDGQQSGPQSREQGSGGLQPQGSSHVQRRTPAAGWRPFVFGPFALIRRMQEDIDRLFGGVARGQSLASRRQSQGPGQWSPAIETFQRGNEFVIRADLPGLSADDVTLEVGEDEVVIAGERRTSTRESGTGCTSAS